MQQRFKSNKWWFLKWDHYTHTNLIVVTEKSTIHSIHSQLFLFQELSLSCTHIFPLLLPTFFLSPLFLFYAHLLTCLVDCKKKEQTVLPSTLYERQCFYGRDKKFICNLLTFQTCGNGIGISGSSNIKDLFPSSSNCHMNSSHGNLFSVYVLPIVHAQNCSSRAKRDYILWNVVWWFQKTFTLLLTKPGQG